MRKWLLAPALLSLLASCSPPIKLDSIILSYSERPTMCIGCPAFHVDLRQGGHVHYVCDAGCAVPGEQDYIVPAERFPQAVSAFHRAAFVAIPRTDPGHVVSDAPVLRLTYRDAIKIHEVVDVGRNLPLLTDLENRMKTATGVEQYLKPSVAVYRRLAQSGWDVNTAGLDRENALTSAVIARDAESIEFLLQRGSTVTHAALTSAAFQGDVRILSQLLEAAAVKPSSTIFAGMLAAAAGNDKSGALEFLLKSGGDVNARSSRDGSTPLFAAVMNGSLANVNLLLSRGADPNVRDARGRTPLWYAATATNTGMITALVQRGAEVNAQDDQGATPLMRAADLCYTWDIRALLDAGANPALAARSGRTALQANVASPGDPKCAESARLLRQAASSFRR